MERVKRILVSPFVWILVTVILMSVTANRWVEVEGAREVVSQWGIWAPLASLVIKTLTNVTPFGAVALAFVNGALFDFWTAVILNLLSGVLSGIAMYYLWRQGDHEWDIRSRIQTLPEWMRRYQADNLWFLILLRVIPWAGGSLADLIAGSHHVPLRTQVLSLVIGYLPGAIIYSLAGAKLASL
jgi:uncharacterized membrane protein YdjX (TVP38/TMEM64 family)